MGLGVNLVVIASLWNVIPAQTAEEQRAPGVEVVRFEVSITKVQRMEARPALIPDPDVQNRQQSSPSSPPRSASEGRQPRYDSPGQEGGSVDHNLDAKAPGPKASKDSPSAYHFIATLVIKNGGARAIKAISWDCVAVSSENKKEISRVSFRNRKKIEPGETVTLAQEVKPSAVERHAEITKVEYEDGTTWQRLKTSK
ncbi:MAG TPA: hypothetical protein VKM94_15835 [Blastocatellia bacterium]|nr:hypothetical protein [Blastocatellia bacterium]